MNAFPVFRGFLFIGLILEIRVVNGVVAVSRVPESAGLCVGIESARVPLGTRLLIELLGQCVERFLERLGVRLDRRGVAAGERRAELLHGRLDLALLALGKLVADLAERLFALEEQALRVILHVNGFLLLLILFRVLLRIAYRAVDVLLGHIGRRGDRDVLLASGAEILCGYVDYAVRVDIEGDLDLRHSAGSCRNSVEAEASECRIARRHVALALEHMDLNGGLTVGCGGIYLALLYRDRRVAVDDAVEYAVNSGVKVITIDSSIESENVSLFIGTDNVGAGKAAGEAAVSGFSSDEKIYIGLVNYNADTDNGRQRETGFREYIKNVENAQIITMVTADSNAESATAAAASLIKGYPEINVLVGFNEWMTLGVGNAIKQLGVKDTVRGIGFDSNVISVGMIETGEMDTLIVQNPFAIGYLGVKNAAVLASGGSISEKTIYTAVTPVNKENLFDEDVQKIIFRFS